MSLIRPLRRVAVPLLAAVLLVCPALACCGSSQPTESASDLLARAKKTLDETKSVHFVLASKGAPKSASGVVGGEGDILRPS